MPDVLVAFGSNLGDSASVFADTLQRFSNREGLTRVQASEPIPTRAVGGSADQPPFVNACLRFHTMWSVQSVFRWLMETEQLWGRKRGQRWGDRIIDLDLLIYGELEAECHVNQHQLVVPHPRMSFRRFVLQPASDVAADMVHPTSGLTIAELLSHLERRPDRIVMASAPRPEFAAAERCQRDCCARHGWDYQAVHDASALAAVSPDTKLVMHAAGIDDRLEDLARAFGGPTLKLRQLDERAVRRETEAAIEAMHRLG